MGKIKLIVGTYNTQAVGADESDFEDAYQSAYKPLLTLLYNHPEVESVLYYSGTLLTWLEAHHPEFHMLLDEMIRRKQVELLGGGFYDPVLPLVPSSDRLGQIELLTTYLRRHFGKRPRGGWITERIWEPFLASTLKNSGLEYTFLSDEHFSAAGLGDDELYRPCLTEDQGKVVVVYPISSRIRQMIGVETPEAVHGQLLSLAKKHDGLTVTLIEDGERFALWDKRGKKMYKGGWLDRFFALLKDERIETLLPARVQKGGAPLKKAYFRGTTYDEMMGWLGDHTFLRDGDRFVARSGARGAERNGGGGNFRQFLSRYAESNLLYSKIMFTHELVNQIRADRHRKQAARDELWKGECNSALWHGRDGGIYNNRVRKAAYRALIEAEKVTRERGIFKPALVSTDFDMDGEEEYLYNGLELNSYVDVVGGALFELEYLPEAWNYLDTMGRYSEPYHDGETSLAFDWYPRKGFVDHFLLPNENINSFDRMSHTELDRLATRPYEVEAYERGRNELRLRANASFTVKNRDHRVDLGKRYTFKKNSVTVAYTLANRSEAPLAVTFASELNIALASNTRQHGALYVVEGEKREDIGLGKTVVDDVGEIAMHDLLNEVGISVSASVRFRLWSLPVETVSRTLLGIDRRYQSSCMVLLWPVRLDPGATTELSVSLAVARL